MADWPWYRVAQGMILLFGGAFILALASWGVAYLPAGDTFIYPLHRLAYLIGEYGHVPSGLVLSVAIITLWPLLVIWGMAHGGSVVHGLSPRIRPYLLLVAVTTVTFAVFRTVEAPQVLQTVSNSTHTYIFSMREHPLDPTEFFLYECDRPMIFCHEILSSDAVNRAWSARIRLDVTDEQVRLLNMQTTVFTYALNPE